MSQSISELESVGLVKSFLGKPEDSATVEEVLAWREFQRIHDLLVRRRIGRIHKSDTVDDIAQEVWCVLFKRLPKFRLGPDLGSVAGWVVKIAHDMASKHARHRSRRAAGALTSEMADEVPDPHLGPDVENEWMQHQDELRLLMENMRLGLSERDQLIADMHFIKGHSAADIAAELKLTDDCVSSVLHRVTLKLREPLHRMGFGPS